MRAPDRQLQISQLLLLLLRVQKLLTFLCCTCEVGLRPHVANATKQEEKIMERIVRNALGLAVALGASSLMFAVTLV